MIRVWLVLAALFAVLGHCDFAYAQQSEYIAKKGGFTSNAGFIYTTKVAPPHPAAFGDCAGSNTSGTYYYRVSATNDVGETTAFAEVSKVLGSTRGVLVKWSGAPGSKGYKVYGRTTGAEQLIATIFDPAIEQYCDAGTVSPSGSLPTTNTTGDSRIDGALVVTGGVTTGGTAVSGTNTGDVTLSAIGSSANANGASLTGQVLTLQPASASFGGVVTTGTQTIAGAKTLSGVTTFSSATGADDVVMNGSLDLGVSGASSSPLAMYLNSANATAPTAYLKKSRGTNASPSAVSASDGLGSLAFAGYQNGAYQRAAHIDTIALLADGTNITGQLQFWTQDGANGDTNLATLDNDIGLSIKGGAGIRIHSYNTQPTCASKYRGEHWNVEGTPDQMQTCKVAADGSTYRWETNATYLVNTAVIDFGSTSIDCAASTGVTVTGAALGDSCTVGISSDMSAIHGNFSCEVTAANTAKVIFCALTATQDPASATYTVRVLH